MIVNKIAGLRWSGLLLILCLLLLTILHSTLAIAQTGAEATTPVISEQMENPAATPDLALEADGHGEHPALPLDISALWVIPFVGMLLSIALGPVLVSHFWEKYQGVIAAFWALAFLVPCALVFGPQTALFLGLESILLDYLPFILLLLALFSVSGGIRIKGSLVGSPIVNSGILLAGTILASWMGTTGAAMLLIRPLLRANKHRKYRAHQVVFFIFLVANIGGALTPLGDPPLFLGFLRGVHFFWTTTHLFGETLLVSALLLGIFFILDNILYSREGCPKAPDSGPNPEKFGIEGGFNFILLAAVAANTVLSSRWSGPVFSIFQVPLPLSAVVRDLAYLLITLLTCTFTSKACRTRNEFGWAPIREVATLFIGIFLTMIPAISILKAGPNGALAGLVSLVAQADGSPNNLAFFWLTGALSSFLDNAPTYVVFFSLAGGDANALMAHAHTLAAISLGAVYMGAMTYIGNAPNFMVRCIAIEQGVKMPSFFGYMLWSIAILVPVFFLMTKLFFV